MRSELTDVLFQSGSKIVTALPIFAGGILVVTDDGQVFKLTNVGPDSYLTTEQYIAKETGT